MLIDYVNSPALVAIDIGISLILAVHCNECQALHTDEEV